MLLIFWTGLRGQGHSELLGVKESTLRSWTSRGKIPSIKLSRKAVRFKESELTNWLAKRAIHADMCSDDSAYRKAKKSSKKSPVTENYIERIIEKAKKDVLPS
jgi:excisionase family DNA binding protein